jgi:hypothetical protein
VTVPWSDIIWAFGGAALIWVMNRINNRFAHRRKSRTDEDIEVKRLSGAVRRQSFLIEANVDRQAMHAQAIIVLANAVKTGDQLQVTRSLDIMSASESQYLASLTARLTRDDKPQDAEEI